jgi:putative sterol carrier protein
VAERPTTHAGHIDAQPTRLRPEKTEGWAARVHFHFTGSSTPEWTVAIDGPACTVERGHHGTPDCVVTTTEDVYLGLEHGEVNAEAAFMSGQLKLSNPVVMMRFTKAFERLGR